MDPAQFLTAPRVTIVAGKGGVGKTTVTAALAVAATRVGLSVLIVEVEGKSAIASLFGRDSLGYETVELIPADPGSGRGSLSGRTLAPDDALVEYLRDHGMKRISARLSSSGALDMVATATPGIRDVLVLGKIKQLERNQAADVILVDAPAAGHAVSFLRSASGLLDAVNVGPIETQAREVSELLSDPDRCEVLLVTLPEETPVNELVETAYNLEDRVGIALGPVVVNGVFEASEALDADPEELAEQAGVSLREGEAESLRIASRFVADRARLQRPQIERLGTRLPLPQICLPFRFTSTLARDDIEALADELLERIALLDEPAA